MEEKQTRRKAIASIASGIGLTVLPTASADRRGGRRQKDKKRRRNGRKAITEKFERLQNLHGSVENTETETVKTAGKKGKGVKKQIHEVTFEDGHQATLHLKKPSDKKLIVHWDRETFVLPRNDGTGFRGNQTQTSDQGLPEPITSGQSDGVSAQAYNMKRVNIGEDETYYDATHGRAKTMREYLGGSAKARYDGTKCELQTKASLLGIPGAYVQTWVTLFVEGQSGNDKHADFYIDLDWVVGWLGGGGSGFWKVGVYVYDYHVGQFIDTEMADKATVTPTDLWQSSGNKTISVGVNLEGQTQYGVGIYVGANSSAAPPQATRVDMWPGQFPNAGAEWDRIRLTWS